MCSEFFKKEMFFAIPKTGPPTPTSDDHAMGRRGEMSGGSTEAMRLLWLSLPLTFPRAHPSVGSKPPTPVGAQPDIPRCSRPPKSWLDSRAVQGREGQVNGSLETTRTSSWKRSLPTCTACIWTHPEPAAYSTLRPQWEVGRCLGRVRVGQEGAHLLDGRPSTFGP